MQTFLPFANFDQTAKALDYRRLGKQRVEAFQILKVLQQKKQGIKAAWANHPAVQMWENYDEALKYYLNHCITEWVRRGYKNTMQIYEVSNVIFPWWLGYADLHRAMRARLIEKDETFYLPIFPDDKGFNGNKYLWPVNETKTFKVI